MCVCALHACVRTRGPMHTFAPSLSWNPNDRIEWPWRALPGRRAPWICANEREMGEWKWSHRKGETGIARERQRGPGGGQEGGEGDRLNGKVRLAAFTGNAAKGRKLGGFNNN